MYDPTSNWQGLTPQQAIQLQRETVREVITIDDLSEVTTVAGVDVGFEDRNTARAAVVVLQLAVPVRESRSLTTPLVFFPGKHKSPPTMHNKTTLQGNYYV